MARRIAAPDLAPDRFGIFHLAGAGATTWSEFAAEIMAVAAAQGMPPVPVETITTADYPTPARRPVNAVLATGKIAAVYGLALPPWQDGVRRCVTRLLAPA